MLFKTGKNFILNFPILFVDQVAIDKYFSVLQVTNISIFSGFSIFSIWFFFFLSLNLIILYYFFLFLLLHDILFSSPSLHKFFFVMHRLVYFTFKICCLSRKPVNKSPININEWLHNKWPLILNPGILHREKHRQSPLLTTIHFSYSIYLGSLQKLSNHRRRD